MILGNNGHLAASRPNSLYIRSERFSPPSGGLGGNPITNTRSSSPPPLLIRKTAVPR
jgi:hypothetical protein